MKAGVLALLIVVLSHSSCPRPIQRALEIYKQFTTEFRIDRAMEYLALPLDEISPQMLTKLMEEVESKWAYAPIPDEIVILKEKIISKIEELRIHLKGSFPKTEEEAAIEKAVQSHDLAALEKLFFKFVHLAKIPLVRKIINSHVHDFDWKSVVSGGSTALEIAHKERHTNLARLLTELRTTS